MIMPAIREKLRANILVVDDRNEHLFAMEKILNSLDCEVYKAHSGNEVMSLTLRHDFSLILLDVNMPEMNGFELAELLHGNNRTKLIPIIFITAYDKEDESIFRGYETGTVDFLFKPVDTDILLCKVKIFLELDLRKKELEAIKIELEQSNDSLERFKSIIVNSSDVYMIVNQDAIIEYVSPSVIKVFGFSPEELIGKEAWYLQTPEEKVKYDKLKGILYLNSDENDLQETKLVDNDENIRDVEMTRSNLVHLPSIGGIVLTLRDITEKKKNAQLITQMAFHDYLTDLPNGRALERRIESIFEKEGSSVNQGIALINIDLDQFQLIKDTLGQRKGDTMLQIIAKRLSSLLNENELLARIEETKFAILVQHQTDYAYCNHLSRLIIDRINEPIFLDGYELYLTANIGISKYQEKPESYEQLAQNANTALSRAKAKGKNRQIIYHASMDIKSFKYFSMVNDIRKVLERKELDILYQPIVDVYSNQKIVGAEALLRWKHPDWGLISPSEFISIAEDTGMIIDIGNWVLRTACEQNRKWKKEGLTAIRVSVNFSPQQFMQENFTETVKSILKETDMDPDMLEMEITESLFINDMHRVSEILKELRDWGVRVALDDFGTGYSSLSLLSEFKMDTLKIDKSFIKDFETDTKRSNLVEAIIKLGHILDMNIVVEGVERVEQYTLLQKYGTNEVQGYYISRPIEQDDFGKLLKSGVSLADIQIISDNRSKIKNRRKTFRVAFSNCLIADMTIDSFQGKKISLGRSEVLISNIGPGGLCFLLPVKLPVGNELMLRFEIEILGKPFTLYGEVMWFNEIEEGKVFEYGIKLLIEDLDRDSLVVELNTLAIQLRKGNLEGVSRSYIGDPYKFIKDHT